MRPLGNRERDSLALLRIAAIVLGVTIGVQEMIAAFLLAPRPAAEKVYAELSDVGRSVYHPERDIPVFLIGSFLSLALALAISRRWETRLRDKSAATAVAIGRRTAWLFLLALGTAVVSFLVLAAVRTRLTSGQPKPHQVALLILPGIAALIVGVVGTRTGRLSRWVSGLMAWLTRPGESGSAPQRRHSRRFCSFVEVIWGLAIVGSIVLLAYVPAYRELAGRVFERDSFHHWDFFVVGPALDFQAGRALGSETYCQYGVGYPLIVSWITRWIPFSYGSLIHLGVIYGGVYFVAIAFGLRLALRSRLWSTCGVLFALLLQCFHGVDARGTIWTYPSASVLRYAMDVWLFVALYIHCRTGHRWAILAAGVIAGVSLLLVLDSGIYLAVAFVGYLTCRNILAQTARRQDPVTAKHQLVGAAQALTAAAATFAIGLSIASRGQLFHREFWPAYLEPLIKYGSGISSLPMATAPTFTWLVAFAVIAAVYLSFLAVLAGGVILHSAGTMKILAGCLAAYGLGTLLQFVNRSAYQNLFHSIVPFCALAIGLLAEIMRRIAIQSSRCRIAAALVPWAVLVLIVIGYAINPVVRQYPNLLSQWRNGRPPRGLSPMKDVRGVSAEREGFVRAFSAITQRMAAMRAAGRPVAVLDWADTMFYLASGVPPADRYCPLVPALLTIEQIADAERRFGDRSFEYVVMPQRNFPAAGGADAYRGFRAIVDHNYDLQEQIGGYGIWIIRSRPALKEAAFRPASEDQPIRR
jgi:hypothetical protein